MNGSQRSQSLVRRVAGSLVCVAIIYAPWAWGCVWPVPLAGLEWLLGAGAVCWILSRIGASPQPKIPLLLPVCTGWILLQGWFMAFNAHSAYDPNTHQFLPVQPPVPFLPGASDRSIAVASMTHLTVILLTLLVAVDLMARRSWRNVIWHLMAIVGAGVACYGLASRWGWLPAMVQKPGFPTSPFGPFNYHGIAGAFLNLVIPLQIGLAAVGLVRTKSRIWGVFYCFDAAITVLGLMVNVSRGAVLIGIAEMAILIFLLLRRLARSTALTRAGTASAAAGPRRFGSWRMVTVGAAALLAAAVSALYLNPRWHSFGRYFDTLHSSRILAWRVSWGMMTAHPLFGSGAGSFKLRFPVSHHWIPSLYSHWIQTFYHPGHHVSQWSYASNDYLQNLVQFGWVGGLAWAGILWGWLFSAWRLKQSNGQDWSPEAVLRSCACVAVLGLFCHATFDYPLEIASIQLYAVLCLGVLYQPVSPIADNVRKASDGSCAPGHSM